jgi:hypothetical protein
MGKRPVVRLKENKARERRIAMEAVVDAYNSEERAMGWYYYLEERLKVPFQARCQSKREISPLRIGGLLFYDLRPKRSP